MTERRRRSLEDILGDEQPAPEKAPKKTRDKKSPRDTEVDWAILRKGVTMTWLTGVSKMDRNTVRKRMAECKPIGTDERGSKLYDLLDAMSYIVKPKFDIAEYMRKMNPTELPPMLRKEYWDAETKRAKFELLAGSLWHTADVVEVLGEAMKRIKNTTQVWADDVEREENLTREQYEYLTKRVDALREDLHKALIDMVAEKRTGSLLETGWKDGEAAEPSEP